MRSLLVLLLLCSLGVAAEPIKAKPAKRPARKQVLLMVRSSQLKAANAAAIAVLGPYGANTFSVPYKKGSTTYYVSACQLTDKQEAAMRAALGKISGTKPTILAKGKGFTGKARAELVRQNFKPKTPKKLLSSQ